MKEKSITENQIKDKNEQFNSYKDLEQMAENLQNQKNDQKIFYNNNGEEENVSQNIQGEETKDIKQLINQMNFKGTNMTSLNINFEESQKYLGNTSQNYVNNFGDIQENDQELIMGQSQISGIQNNSQVSLKSLLNKDYKTINQGKNQQVLNSNFDEKNVVDDIQNDDQDIYNQQDKDQQNMKKSRFFIARQKRQCKNSIYQIQK
ncbi:hypothetical protein PPERSA_11495 [Pseudocohnilembus persalinus]|uniref:Uncharacterized protein n=1 Tax=Pseudocohnilembus persalinus TaxID=266149 RepID=A0A0V0QX81_PSEPJ|nr:hypothetical protein PPERSA_11495 [Pseudocohnilembus persalinus]|eukprot:KRX06850.1 hypothetical protein PPERSA_11495 [Pseudocohnilembus persalinus]